MQSVRLVEVQVMRQHSLNVYRMKCAGDLVENQYRYGVVGEPTKQYKGKEIPNKQGGGYKPPPPPEWAMGGEV